MRVLLDYAVLAVFAVQTSHASAPIQARQTPIAEFFLEGPLIQTGLYANYTISVLEDSSKVIITNPMDVISIIPSDTKSNCTFVFADGSVAQIEGSQQDVYNEPIISVTCAARSGPVVTPTGFPDFTSYFPNLETVVPNAVVTSAVVSYTTMSG